MKNNIVLKVACECGGQLAINQVAIDLVKCEYVIFCDCILCGQATAVPLSLEDFIDVNRKEANNFPLN